MFWGGAGLIPDGSGYRRLGTCGPLEMLVPIGSSSMDDGLEELGTSDRLSWKGTGPRKAKPAGTSCFSEQRVEVEPCPAVLRANKQSSYKTTTVLIFPIFTLSHHP